MSIYINAFGLAGLFTYNPITITSMIAILFAKLMLLNDNRSTKV